LRKGFTKDATQIMEKKGRKTYTLGVAEVERLEQFVSVVALCVRASRVEDRASMSIGSKEATERDEEKWLKRTTSPSVNFGYKSLLSRFSTCSVTIAGVLL
jgi:hypothetical protein